MSHPTVAVVLSGCGFKDGAEITEAVLTLTALDQEGATYQCIAPRLDFVAIDHATGKPSGEKRNVFTEAARISRGNLKTPAEINAKDYDALLFPGGFGAASNLCTYATAGRGATVLPEIAKLVQDFHAQGKPICTICIAPMLIAKAIGNGVELTIGTNAGVAADLEALGGHHVACPVTEMHVDATHNVISTPAYMESENRALVFEGIRKAVKATLSRIPARV